MESVIETDTEESVWHAPAWYRALWLTERIAPGRPQAAGGSSVHAELLARARRRLDAWKEQRPFQDEALFEERLRFASLTESDLLTLLAEPAERIKARVPAPPDWLVSLRAAFRQARPSDDLQPLLDEVERDHPLVGCLPALSPLLERGLASLEDGVDALDREHGTLPVDRGMLRAIFLKNIAHDLLFQVTKPLITEMNIARLQGRLRGETPEARFHDFLRQLSEERLMLSLLVKYPVLARQLMSTIDQWAEYLREVLAHLCADWRDLCAVFADHGDPGPLVELEAGKGDKHRRGRTVLLLRFGSGLRVLYKPKPLGVDVHFQQLLTWLNERGAEPPLRPLRLLDRGEYGWSEFVVASPCATAAEVERFYERQGAYLALLYVLEAVDLHNENLIAVGEHPMFVDLEALFHPRVHRGDPVLNVNAAARALDESVWQVGILPRRIWSRAHSAGVDVSGLGGQPGQTNPARLVSWEAAGTDAMRLRRDEHVELPAKENRPRVGDQDVDLLDYRHAITAGFTRMYRLLGREREALRTEQLPRFAEDQVRVILRATQTYAELWYEAFHPDLLHDALDRERFFDRLWAEVAQRPDLARVVATERRDLVRGDVPVFRTTPGSRTLFTSDGEPVHDFFDTPSLDLVHQRLERLGDDDLAKQVWIIEASLMTLSMGAEDVDEEPLPIPARAPTPRRQDLLSAATEIGGRLGELSLRNEVGAYWLGVGLVDEYEWNLMPTGSDLYGGTGGIALFLAHLGAVTGEPSPTLVAERAVGSLRAQLAAEESGEDDVAVGGFEGLSSVIYVLTHLGVLWNDAALFREANALVERLPPYIAKDDHLDVLNGSAGCILALLSLHAVKPSRRTLEVAVQCGDHLLDYAQPMPQGVGWAWASFSDDPPLSGFSHGSAGIALSLLKLAAATGEQRFHRAALDGLTYERGLFVPELGNWADVRLHSSRRAQRAQAAGSERKAMVAWCHGAPGIGLARLAGLPELDDPTVREEIDAALKTTIRAGFAGNHSLCHGALGNVELLLTAAELLGRDGDHDALERAAATLVASIRANGPVTGVPLSVETPGFMVGLAGIGYQLLRLAEPEKVPSTLVLAPPISSPNGRV